MLAAPIFMIVALVLMAGVHKGEAAHPAAAISATPEKGSI
jgi:hypothetical protein